MRYIVLAVMALGCGHKGVPADEQLERVHDRIKSHHEILNYQGIELLRLGSKIEKMETPAAREQQAHQAIFDLQERVGKLEDK